MNRIHPGRAMLFVCFLAVLLALVYFAKSSWESKRAERQQAATAASAEAARNLGLVNTNIARTLGSELIAVACAAEDRTMNAALGEALAQHFKTDRIKFSTSVFRPTLITDGSFDAVFNGSKDAFAKMNLDQTVDGLLLARQSVMYSTNTALDSVITANMHVQILTLPVSRQIESQSWTLAAKGTGFNNADARMQAEAGIIQQINESTNLVLTQF